MAALPSLASLQDLEERLGRSLSGTDAARAEALLRDASAAVRRFTRQEITRRESTERVAVVRGHARLSQMPVVSITSVVDLNGVTVSATWESEQIVEVWPILVVNGPSETSTSLRCAPPYADVTYVHGFATVPEDVVAVVCQVAGRAFGRPADSAGATSEQIGTYRVTVGAAAAAGALGLLEDEKRILTDYRTTRGPIMLSTRL